MTNLFETRRRALLVVGVLVLALVLAGRLLVRAGAPSAAPPPPIPTATGPPPAALLVVDVVGAVQRPGLYRLREGARIADAVARAGGPTAEASLELVNLAAPLADGIQIVVPRKGEAAAAAAASGAPGAPGAPVHLSTATVEQLDALPGIGPVTAQKIVDYRTEHGAFHSVDELDAVPGIGLARIDQLRDLVAP